MNNAKTIITVVLVAIVALFAVQNAAMVEIQFMFWHIAMPRAMLVVLLLLVGFVLGFLAGGHKKSTH